MIINFINSVNNYLISEQTNYQLEEGEIEFLNILIKILL